MIIQCPNCQAQYDLGPNVSVVGRKVRCSQCGNVWQPEAEEPPQAAPPEAAAPDPSIAEAPRDDGSTAADRGDVAQAPPVTEADEHAATGPVEPSDNDDAGDGASPDASDTASGKATAKAPEDEAEATTAETEEASSPQSAAASTTSDDDPSGRDETGPTEEASQDAASVSQDDDPASTSEVPTNLEQPAALSDSVTAQTAPKTLETAQHQTEDNQSVPAVGPAGAHDTPGTDESVSSVAEQTTNATSEVVDEAPTPATPPTEQTPQQPEAPAAPPPLAATRAVAPPEPQRVPSPPPPGFAAHVAGGPVAPSAPPPQPGPIAPPPLSQAPAAPTPPPIATANPNWGPAVSAPPPERDVRPDAFNHDASPRPPFAPSPPRPEATRPPGPFGQAAQASGRGANPDAQAQGFGFGDPSSTSGTSPEVLADRADDRFSQYEAGATPAPVGAAEQNDWSQLDWPETPPADAFAEAPPAYGDRDFDPRGPAGDVTAADFEPDHDYRAPLQDDPGTFAGYAETTAPSRANRASVLLGWLLLGAVTLGLLGSIVAMPERVASAFPGSRGLLAGAGLVETADANAPLPGDAADLATSVPGSGPVQIDGLDLAWEVRGRTASLRIVGRIVNVHSEAIPMPRLTFVLTGRDGVIRLVQTVDARDQWLAPGASSRLAVRLIPPSVDLARLGVRLAPPKPKDEPRDAT